MHVELSRVTASKLEIGSLYISKRDKGGYFCIAIYLGRNYKNYYVFYDLCDIRYESLDKNRFELKNIDLGTDVMLNVYRDVVIEALSKPVEGRFFRVLSSPSGSIFNKLNLKVDTSAFIERNKGIVSEKKICVITDKNIISGEYYIDTSFQHIYLFKECANKRFVVNDYSGYFTAISDWPDKREYAWDIHENVVALHSWPKVYKLSDAMQHTSVMADFKALNERLYDWTLKTFKGKK